MKYKSLFIPALIFSVIIWCAFPVASLAILSKDEILANQIMAKVAKKIELEKELHLIGTGSAMLDQIKMLSLSFEGFQELTIEQARELIVYAVTAFTDEVNSNEAVRPYLANYPFSSKNIEVCIFFYKQNYSQVDSPNIGFVVNWEGSVEYYPGAPKGTAWKPLLEESYEEAVKILSYING